MASLIECFLVFDGRPQKTELSAPPLFFVRTESEESKHFAENQAGIFLTLIKFAKFFTNKIPVDYALTNHHEIAIVELCDNIWISISKKNLGTPNRHLLYAIANCCIRLYNLFFPKPVRDDTGNVSRRSAKLLNSSFAQIIQAISYTNLTFIHLFDSFFQADPPPNIKLEFNQIASQILSADSPIVHLAVMHSRNFIYSTFPTDIANTIAVSLQTKFPYLFPRVLIKDEEHLYWIIGLSRSDKGPMNVYAPPLLIDNEQYPLVALRYKKFKILMTIKPQIVPTPEVFLQIPPRLKNLKQLLNKLRIETTKCLIDYPFIVISSNTEQRQLSLFNKRISDASIPIAEQDIIRGHFFSHLIGNFSTVGFLGRLGYFMHYIRDNQREKMTYVKCSASELSKQISFAKEIADEVNTPHLTFTLK